MFRPARNILNVSSEKLKKGEVSSLNLLAARLFDEAYKL